MSRQVYVGKIKNSQYEVNTLVNAENHEEAVKLVLEKFKDDLGKYFTEADVEVALFFQK